MIFPDTVLRYLISNALSKATGNRLFKGFIETSLEKVEIETCLEDILENFLKLDKKFRNLEYIDVVSYQKIENCLNNIKDTLYKIGKVGNLMASKCVKENRKLELKDFIDSTLDLLNEQYEGLNNLSNIKYIKNKTLFL